jgi:hypothetical protein
LEAIKMSGSARLAARELEEDEEALVTPDAEGPTNTIQITNR